MATLRRLAKEHGVLKSTHVPSGLMKACNRFWGTWEDICRNAGVEHLDHVPRGYWTRERVVDALRERIENDRPVTANALGAALAAAIWRHFGPLEKALAAARQRK